MDNITLVVAKSYSDRKLSNELNTFREPEKEIVKTGINIFNPNLAVVGKTVNYNGKIIDASNGNCISQTFDVKHGETAITISYVTSNGIHQLQNMVVTFFDSSMNMVYQALNTTHVIPTDAKYFIVNIGYIFANALNRIMIQYGNEMTYFESYCETTEKIPARIKNESLEFVDNFSSRNAYNYKTRTDGSSMNIDGSVIPHTYRSVSDFIPCYGKIEFSASNGAEGVYCFYDKNKKFISPYGVFSNGKEGIKIPDLAHYIRVSLITSYANTFVLSFTETAVLYEKHEKTYIGIKSDVDKNGCKSVISEILANGRQIKFIGDSITQGVGGTGFEQDGEEIRSGWNVNTTGYCFANLFKKYIETKYGNTVLNYGTRGVRSYNLVSWMEANDGYITEDDKLLIVMIGTNNKWATTTDTLVDLKNDLQWIVDWCAENDKKLILVSAPMSTVIWDTQYSDGTTVKFHNEDIDHTYKEVCHRNNMDYVPMYQRMVEYCDLKDIDISTIFDDGLHPNDQGYYIMYKILMKELGLGYQLPDSAWDDASPKSPTE